MRTSSNIMKCLFFCISMMIGAQGFAKKVISKSKPNIIFIFTDDQKWNTINALGNEHIHTPNLDRLSQNAMVFNNAYCFGGNTGAVCIPSRNMVMSGKVFFRFEEDARQKAKQGIKRRKPWYTNPDWATLPKSMKAAGYETFYREKSGSANNPDVRNQFDFKKDIHMVNALRSGRPGKEIVDDALHYLSDERDINKPFFMYLGFPCPHDPRWSLKEFRDLYDQEKLPIPENYLPVHPWNIGDMTVRDECLEAWPRTKEAIQRHLLDYYAVVSSMDYDIGRLLDGLKSMNLDENTIIVFSSDQGLAIGDHGLMGKQNVYEGTLKVPMFVAGPGIKKGHSDAFVYLHDVFPTICDLADTDIPEELDGKSFQHILYEGKGTIRKSVMMAYRDYQRSIRQGKWKLIRFPKIDKTVLFDLEQDPNETQNLASNPKYAQRISSMMKLLQKEGELLGDRCKLYVEEPLPAKFNAPKEKLKTAFPAGGLAPGDPSYKE
ncbi:DUF4976 domain-containing protein [Puteibacter caeruleilacunae]|nr:DUF4976 domain-containing protein [Puteibacter caeruleilacunae]